MSVDARNGLKKVVTALSPTPGIRSKDTKQPQFEERDDFVFSVVTENTKPMLEILLTEDTYTSLGKNTSLMKEYAFDNESSIKQFTWADVSEPVNEQVTKRVKEIIASTANAKVSKHATAAIAKAPVSVGIRPLEDDRDVSDGEPEGSSQESVILERMVKSWVRERYSVLMAAWYEAPLCESAFRGHVADREQRCHSKRMMVPLASGRCRVSLQRVDQATGQTTLRIVASSTDDRSPYAICAVLHDKCKPVFEIIETVFGHPMDVWDQHTLRTNILKSLDQPFEGRLECTHSFPSHAGNLDIDANLEELRRKWPYDVKHASVTVDSSNTGTVVLELAVNKLDAERGLDYFVTKSQSTPTPFELIDALRTTGDHAPACISPISAPDTMQPTLSMMLTELVDIRAKCVLQIEYHSTDELESISSSLSKIEHPLVCGLRVLLKGLVHLLDENRSQFGRIETLARTIMLVLDVDVGFASNNPVAYTLAGVFRSMLYDDTLRQDFAASSISNELFESTTWPSAIANEAMSELCALHGDAMRDGSRLSISGELAFRWRVFQSRRVDIVRALALRNVHGLRALTSWTNIDCELRFDDLVSLCRLQESSTAAATIAWLTTLAWQLHKDSPATFEKPNILKAMRRIDAAEQELRSAHDTHRAYELLTMDDPDEPLSITDLHRLDAHVVDIVYEVLCRDHPSLVHELRSVHLPPCAATSDKWVITDCVDLVRRLTTLDALADRTDLTTTVTSVLTRIGDALVADHTYEELVRLLRIDDRKRTQWAAPRAASLVMYARARDHTATARLVHLDNHLLNMYDATTVITSQPLQRSVIATHVLSLDMHGRPINPNSGAVAFDVIGLSPGIVNKASLIDAMKPHNLMIPNTFYSVRLDEHDYVAMKRCDCDRLGVDFVNKVVSIDASSPLLDVSFDGVHEIHTVDSMEIVATESNVLADPFIEAKHEEDLVMDALKRMTALSVSDDIDQMSECYTASLRKLASSGTPADDAVELLWWVAMRATRQLPPVAYAEGLPTPLGTVDRPLYLPRDGTLADWYEWSKWSHSSEATDEILVKKPTAVPCVLHTGGLPVASFDWELQLDICRVVELHSAGQDIKHMLKPLLKRTLCGARVCLPWIVQTVVRKKIRIDDVDVVLRLFGWQAPLDDSDHCQDNRRAFLTFSSFVSIPLMKKTVGSPDDDLLYEIHRRVRDAPPAGEDLVERQLRQLHQTMPYSPTIMTNANADQTRTVLVDLFRPHALAVLAHHNLLFGSSVRANVLVVELLARVGGCAPLFISQPDAFGDLLRALELPGFPQVPSATSCVMLNTNHNFVGIDTNEGILCDVDTDALMRPFEALDEGLPSNLREPIPKVPINGNLRNIWNEPRVRNENTLVEEGVGDQSYFVDNGDMLNSVDSFLSANAVFATKGISRQDYSTMDSDFETYVQQLDGVDKVADARKYQTWYRNLCTKYLETTELSGLSLQDIKITSNTDCAALQEQAVLHTAAWLLYHANRLPEDYAANYKPWIENPMNQNGDEPPPLRRPLFPKEFLPNKQQNVEDLSRVAITFLSMLNVTAATYEALDRGAQTVQSLVHLQNRFTNLDSGRQVANVPAQWRCLQKNPDKPLNINPNIWSSLALPNIRWIGFKDVLEMACVLKMQSSSDGIKYTFGDRTLSAKACFNAIFPKTDSFKDLVDTVKEAVYCAESTFNGKSEEQQLSLRADAKDQRHYDMYCRQVQDVPSADHPQFPHRRIFQTSDWNVAQPNMAHNANPNQDVPPADDPREVTNGQTNGQTNGNRHLYIDELRGIRRFVRGDHRGEAWMVGDQTTPEGLRNVAQAVRNHMTHQRVMQLKKDNESNDLPKEPPNPTKDDLLMGDLRRRLNATKFDGNPLVTSTKIVMGDTQLGILHSLLGEVIGILVTQCSEALRTDLHLRESAVFVQVLIAMFVARITGAAPVDISWQQPMLISTLRYMPYVWIWSGVTPNVLDGFVKGSQKLWRIMSYLVSNKPVETTAITGLLTSVAPSVTSIASSAWGIWGEMVQLSTPTPLQTTLAMLEAVFPYVMYALRSGMVNNEFGSSRINRIFGSVINGIVVKMIAFFFDVNINDFEKTKPQHKRITNNEPDNRFQEQVITNAISSIAVSNLIAPMIASLPSSSMLYLDRLNAGLGRKSSLLKWWNGRHAAINSRLTGDETQSMIRLMHWVIDEIIEDEWVTIKTIRLDSPEGRTIKAMLPRQLKVDETIRRVVLSEDQLFESDDITYEPRPVGGDPDRYEEILVDPSDKLTRFLYELRALNDDSGRRYEEITLDVDRMKDIIGRFPSESATSTVYRKAEPLGPILNDIARNEAITKKGVQLLNSGIVAGIVTDVRNRGGAFASACVGPVAERLFDAFWLYILLPHFTNLLDSTTENNLLVKTHVDQLKVAAEGPKVDLRGMVVQIGLMVAPLVVNKLVNSAAVNKLKEVISTFLWQKGNATEEVNSVIKSFVLCGWYTTAQLKLLGERRVDENRWFVDDRLRIKHDLQLLTEYMNITDFKLLYEPSDTKELDTSNDNRKQALVQVLKHKTGQHRVDVHIARDFEKAVVMARDGSGARRSRLWLREGQNKYTYASSDYPVLINALREFFPTNGPHNGHVKWNVGGSEATLSDAFYAALTNLLAINGSAEAEYEAARKLQPKNQFDRIWAKYSNDEITFRTTHLQTLQGDGRLVKHIEFALYRRFYKNFQYGQTGSIVVETLERSIKRQAYSLLGRFYVAKSDGGIHTGTKFFEYTPSYDDIRTIMNHPKDSDDFRSGILEDEKSWWVRVCFVPYDDIFMGSFAYPSSLIEQQL